MTPLELTQEAARLVDSNKGTKILIQDLQGFSDICNYQMVCSAANTKQAKALSRLLEDHFKSKYDTKPIMIEGREVGNWILMDYGGAIIHLFERTIRDYYAIDQLWPKATPVGY